MKLLRSSALFIFIIATFVRLVHPEGCNYITLVKCFINILDEWTWTLYELKDNVVTINNEQCEHLRQLDKCVQDDGPEAHYCEHNEIVQASNTVSDLLVHRKNSGSFLKSYYLLTFACSKEGQELLNEHRSCLKREGIGEMTLSAGTYLSEKFLEHPEEDVCHQVNNKLQEYMDAMGGLCNEEASLIMCKSLTNMFRGLHKDKLHSCEFVCEGKAGARHSPQHDDTAGYDTDASEEDDDEPTANHGESEGLSGGNNGSPATGSAYSTVLPLLLFLGTALVLLR